MENGISFTKLENVFAKLKEQKIGDIDIQDIVKYLLVSEEMKWIEENIGDNRNFYNYDGKVLDDLSYKVSNSISNLIHDQLLQNHALYTKQKKNDFELEIL